MGDAFQSPSPRSRIPHGGLSVDSPIWSHNPAPASATAHMHGTGLGSSPFARHYLGSRSLLLEVLRCFSSLGSLTTAYRFNWVCPPITADGLPHSGISGSPRALPLPGAFRSAPRPSSCLLYTSDAADEED